MGKQRTVHGAYSGDFEESKVGGRGFDDLAFNPGPTPNKYVSNAKGKNSIDLSRALDSQTYDDIGTEGDGLKGGGFSGPVSRNRK
jgi:hypothetical protein